MTGLLFNSIIERFTFMFILLQLLFDSSLRDRLLVSPWLIAFWWLCMLSFYCNRFLITRFLPEPPNGQA